MHIKGLRKPEQVGYGDPFRCVTTGIHTIRIGDYSFGEISVDGMVYKSDVIAYPDKADPSWWRNEGHCLRMNDLAA